MAADHQVGDVIDDRFELLFAIRSGGLGVEWRARDLLEESEVVVKEIRFPDVLGEDERKALTDRLLDEARTLRNLEHPGLVQVTEVLDSREPPLVITELIDGPSLADIADTDGPLSPERVAVVGAAALEALAACADVGVSHRFLRPSRILLPYDGPVRVCDFGIAALVGDPGVTNTGAVEDSAAFLPPEHGSEQSAAEAADMWALGITLYTALEGEHPFARDTAKDTRSAITGEPSRAAERAGPLQPVLAALLEKDPDERPDMPRLREMLAEVTMTSVRVRTGPLEPAEALDRMFARDPDIPQLHLVPPDSDDEPATIAGQSASAAATRERHDRSAGGGSDDLGDGEGGDGEDPQVAPDDDWLGGDWLDGGSDGGSGGDPEAPNGAGAPLSEVKPKSDLRRRIWMVVCAVSIVGILGSVLAFGGQQPTVTAGNDDVDRWETFTHEEVGYSIDIPPNWTVSTDGNLTDFNDPTTGAALRVGFQDPARAGSTPHSLWLALESEFQEEQPTYDRVQLVQRVHEGYPAAIWEFTWTDDAVRLHNYDLAFTAGGRSFALNFQTRQADWLELRDLFELFLESFQVPE